ncbi:TRAP transporter small permease subunit [Tranquillimonas alkanivorans]|uniref:TRAP transporter small permease protein n=1 Tax=Tranquillimonas alkanivorans TaxID=441119 RepID=A0A1I5TLD3_9RHOB|nr:TRAP transporter small permease [Tranquillimonas alkanivorans]SFP83855.1 TRAP-type C4-dicarboxylate transport system, small permease component [Tranquillimonas alkanivorans]
MADPRRSPIGMLDAAVTRVSRWFGYLAAALIVYVLCHILVEVTLRNVFSTSTFVLDEYVGYALAGIIFLSLAATHQAGHHIRVRLVSNTVQGRGKDAAELIANIAALVVCIMLFVSLYGIFDRNLRFGITSAGMSRTPLWIPQIAVVVGIAWYCVRLATNALVCVEALVLGPNREREPA